MDNFKNLNYFDEYSILVITEKGFLKLLHVPFQVRCIQNTDGIKANTLVFVDAVKSHQTEMIMYRILKVWIPYNYFKLVL